MPVIRPFRAIRYTTGADPARVTAPVYDVIGPEDQALLEALDPHNFVRVILPADTGSSKYTRAAEHLSSWLETGVLAEETAEGYKLYRFDYEAGGAVRATAGVVAALELTELEGQVVPHERTMPGPKADRLALMRTTRANVEPIWLVAARPMGVIGKLTGLVAGRSPSADLLDPDGTRHRIWDLSPAEGEILAEAIGRTPLVIADGHHRYETALRYRQERRVRDGPGPWDQAMALIVDPVEQGPTLLPIHRLVAGRMIADMAARTELNPFAGDLRELSSFVRETGPGVIGVAQGEACFTMKSTSAPDTEFLARQVLMPLEAGVEYEHDFDRLALEVARGGLGFVMAPVPLQLVIDTAMSGATMPPKTTLFWPKPRSGLLIRDLDRP